MKPQAGKHTSILSTSKICIDEVKLRVIRENNKSVKIELILE